MGKSTRVCDINGCERKHYARGWCTLHYGRWFAKGTTHEPNPHYHDPEESFAARTRQAEGGCLIWTGRLDKIGYGRIAAHGNRQYMAHRYAWERVNEAIPEGMVIDHLCHNRACVNADHLRLVTQAQNMQNIKSGRAGSKSGIRGVNWREDMGKWAARVMVAGKSHWGGLYDTAEEAGRVAAEMRAELMPYSQN